MALHGSAAANLSPIFFKGNNRSFAVNLIIHQDRSGSMNDVSQFYNDGIFIESLQDALISEGIGEDIDGFPNLYSYFGTNTRRTPNTFSITNQRGTLNFSSSLSTTFIRGESTGSDTKTIWSSYFTNITSSVVNICNEGGRLNGFSVDSDTNNSGVSPYSEDVHGNIWSIYTTPNSISSQVGGSFGSVIGSPVRKGTTNIIITNSDEQSNAPSDMIGTLVNVGSGSRTINGSTGEISFREYRVIALSSYDSSDGYDGVLFYGSSYAEPYGYVKFTGASTYTITRSSSLPNWTNNQQHDTLTITSQSRGALFKIRNVFTNTGVNYRVALSNCLAEFIATTV
jgi:hypothetical protein